jgi:hypothetical protein
MTTYEKAIILSLLLASVGIVAFFGYDCYRWHRYLRVK